jgi:hypothetical protein
MISSPRDEVANPKDKVISPKLKTYSGLRYNFDELSRQVLEVQECRERNSDICFRLPYYNFQSRLV